MLSINFPQLKKLSNLKFASPPLDLFIPLNQSIFQVYKMVANGQVF